MPSLTRSTVLTASDSDTDPHNALLSQQPLAAGPHTTTYSFRVRADVVNRDTVLVPAGWDSWSKILILKEGFDCQGISQAWDADVTNEELKNDDTSSTEKMYLEVIKNPRTVEQVNK